MMNEKVLVRGDKSGVFFGTLAAKEGSEVTLKNCRRIWYWKGASSLSQLALEGAKKPEECKFTVTVPEMVILDAIEIIPCSPEAILNIEGVKVWKA